MKISAHFFSLASSPGTTNAQSWYSQIGEAHGPATMQTWSAKVKGEARLLLTNAVTAPAFRLEISDAGVVRAGQEIEQRRIEEAADDHANDDRQRRDDQSVTQLPQMLEERHRGAGGGLSHFRLRRIGRPLIEKETATFGPRLIRRLRGSPAGGSCGPEFGRLAEGGGE